VGAAQSLWVEFESNVSLEEVQEALRGAPSILVGGDELPEAIDEEARAVLADQEAGPLDVVGSTAVHVARLRLDPLRADCLGMWIAFDDLRKGVAVGVATVFERAWGRYGPEY
jgi:aspartate-semialdehyde dehydrogenase